MDIYTKLPITTRSEEHILLNCLGGRLRSSELIDKTTNDTFGQTIDAALSRMVAFPRVVLGARSGDGVEPGPLKGLKSEAAGNVNLLSGGKPQMAKPQLTCTHEDGKLIVRGTSRDLGELARLTKRIREKHGIPLEAFLEGSTSKRSYVGLIEGEIEFGTDVAQCIGKMACNLFAHSNRSTFLRSEFDPIRDFVLHGAGDARDFMRVNSRPVNCQKPSRRMGELDHLIVVRRVPKGGAVEATICIYGHLQFTVCLGHTSVAVVPASYRVDQLSSSARLNHPHDLKVTTRKLSALRSVSETEELEAWSKAWRAVLGIVTKRQEKTWQERMIGECIEEAFGKPDGGVITKEMVERFSQCVAERFVSESPRFRHLHNDSEFRTRVKR